MAGRVHLGLGSNQGERLGHLRFAVQKMRAHPRLRVRQVSSVYETAYVGPGTQDPYLNACVQVETDLEPEGLLDLVKGWERERGRAPDGHMRPRCLDVDILLWEGLVLETDRLRIPHPRLAERLFVLAPLEELSPDEKIPNSGETVRNLCAKIRRKCGQEIRPWAQGIEAPASPGAVMEE